MSSADFVGIFFLPLTGVLYLPVIQHDLFSLHLYSKYR